LANDPVGSGLAASLARPGGNVTGLSLLAPDLAGKRLEAFYASFCPMFADWPFWEMPAIPPPWLKWSTSRRQLTGSDLRR
jgi:hypothetical protein